jgi:hypothetical protein
MMKRIGVVAVLAACSSQDDFTQVTSRDPAVDQRLSPRPAGGIPAAWLTRPTAATATPSFIWAAPAASAASPGVAAPGVVRGGAAGSVTAVPSAVEQAARAHLAGPASHYRYAPAQVAELSLREVHDTGTGAVIARFNRRVDGLEVFGQQVSVAMDRNLDALALSGDVSGERSGASSSLADKAAGSASGFTLAPEQAVIVAVADVTGVELERSDLGAALPAPGSYERIDLGPRALSKLGIPAGTAPARTKMTLFPSTTKRLLPAYYVEADAGSDAEGKPRYFAHVISAADGAILWKRDLTAYEAYSYRVYADASGLFTPWDGPQGTSPTPHPSGEPDPSFAPDFVPSQLVTLSSLESIGVTDPWLPESARETVGNNVDAYLDISPPDGFTLGTDFRGQVSSPGVFDAEFDPDVDANVDTEQQTAAVTQLFYNLNWFHDWYYAAGFTEAAGNAQTSNFERGGLGEDAIHAEAQDGNGFNNANMSTPADGAPPRMQMYLWDFGPSSLTVTGPEGVAGTYETGAAAFAPKRFDTAGPIVRATPVDGCAPLEGDYAGAIVLIDRGGDACGEFAIANKAANAQQAGAVGMILANVPSSNDPENPSNPTGTPPFPITIGVLTVNLSDGDRLRAALAEGSELGGALFRDAMLRDGDFDNQIVAHEWGHYISNRLVANGAGLGTNMGSGLGEGWGDFHAMLITVRPEDVTQPGNANWNGVYGLGGYASGAFSPDGYYFGVRRYPYSTDVTKDPLTFKHISNDAALPEGVPNSGDGDHTEVHNIGEVWATMLWESYAAILRDTLGASPRLTFAEARDRMRDYIVAAYKLTPANPTLLEARDALLAAALARDPIDLERFSQAFARRGAGVFAVGPNRFDATNGGIVESYIAGSAVEATTARLLDDEDPFCSADGILDSREIGTLRVTFRNIGNAPSEATTAQVTAALAAAAGEDSVFRRVRFPDGPTIAIPALPIFGSVEASVRVALDGLTEITPVDFSVQVADTGAGEPPPKRFGFLTNADEVPYQSFTDSAESTNVVWSIDSSDSTVPEAGRWQRTELSLTEHEYHCSSSSLAAVVDFRSPPLQLVEGEAFTVSFKHRFSFESDAETNFDGGVIELSNDGGATWTDIGQDLAGYNGTLFEESGSPLGGRAAFVADSPNYPEYANQTLDFGSQYGGDTVLIRFRVASDSGTASTGWDIDDISLTGVAEPPFDAVLPQSSTCSELPPPLTFVSP